MDKQKLKNYNVYISIEEIMGIMATSEEEAEKLAYDQLEEAQTIWTTKDIQLKAEVYKE